MKFNVATGRYIGAHWVLYEDVPEGNEPPPPPPPSPERVAEVNAMLAAHRAERKALAKRRRRQFMAALVFLVVAYVAAVVTTWMAGISVFAFIALPLYALGLAAFYGPWGWSLDGSLSRKSTVEKIGGK